MGFEYHSHQGHSTWIELSSTGDLLGSYHLGDCAQLCHVPVAMTAGGSVYAAAYSGDTFLGWAAFNRLKRTWPKLAGYPKGKIIGSDGEDLVFAKHDERRNTGATRLIRLFSTRDAASDGCGHC